MQASLASSYLPTLRAGRWFSALAPQFADLLLALAQPRRLEAGEALFLRGDALEGGLFAVVRGSETIQRILTLTRVAELLVLIDDPDALVPPSPTAPPVAED